MRGLTVAGRPIRAAVAILVGIFAIVTFILTGVTGAQAGQNAFIEVTPNTAQAGTRVNLRGGCDDRNNQQAEVHSDAFGGRVLLRPDNGFLTGAATIPGGKAAGDYPVQLRCDNGATAETTITVLNMTQPSKGPATGGGGTADDRGNGSLVLVGGLTAAAVAAGFGLLGARRRRAGTGH